MRQVTFNNDIPRTTATMRTIGFLTSMFGYDSSPCVLPDGRIVSLWLDRPEGSGAHEMKVMAADGRIFFMLLPDVDVLDGGIGCG